ncbi:hypothetical protein COO60DRAFT_1643549 [Scenedesmus sp. NREL 46B-D3]|nr:hypothetical protein COO60DRAFT_1643549 [Scenedesmus sp. NREL 46B-D3]
MLAVFTFKIRLAANDGDPLTPHKTVVQLFSKCAAGLPEEPGADTVWDLSNMAVDGQPVSRPLVVAWLNAAYRRAYEAAYEELQAF